MTSMKSRRLRRSLPDDFEEVFQTTSKKSSGLPGSHMDFMEIWKTSGTTYLLVVWKSSGLPGSLLTKSSDKVVWTSWKSSGLPKSRLTKSSGLPVKSSGLPKSLLTKSSGLPGSRLDFLKVVWTSWKSSDKVFFHIKWSPSLSL
ncbi:hypothetical protein F2Q69_00029110 [Brassica cretica]|uniref:Uncharacterized protein n=1 Tax=Brassica cretica TaxID=69181 RepID=A0A8S9RW11_BRACR|nr:hypothetical protein F2Q69_00029110 [Brassica cretica]